MTVSEIDEFKEELAKAMEGSGFTLATDEEMEEFLADSKAYQESSDGQADSMAQEAVMDFYLAKTAKYTWEEGMDEISGFGGSYEKVCQVMLDVGIQWLDDHPDADPQFSSYPNVTGIINEDNEDAETMYKVVSESTNGYASGAMMQIALSQAMWVRHNGWDEYVRIKKEAGDVDDD